MQDLIRQQGMYKLSRKYENEPGHAKQVKKLSLCIFDKTFGDLHDFTQKERDLVEAGALLHDIGYFISEDEHNKHSFKLIMKEGIEGFISEEVKIVACIARFHRGKSPLINNIKLSDKKAWKTLKKLSSIVKLADGLDRSHLSIVEDIDCVYDSFSQILHLIMQLSVPECSLEICAAEKEKRFI